MNTVLRALGALTLLAFAMSARAADTDTAHLAYDDEGGSMWTMTFIRIEVNGFDDYMTNLRANWKPIQDAAKKDGIILSYKLLSADAATPEDWNFILMTEFKSLTAMDEGRKKFKALAKRLEGSVKAMDEKIQKIREKNKPLRTFYGDRLAWEVNLKD